MAYCSSFKHGLPYGLTRFLVLGMFSEVPYDLLYMEYLIAGFLQTEWKVNGFVTCKITLNVLLEMILISSLGCASYFSWMKAHD